MSLEWITVQFTGQNIINFFFKAFAILFSIIFLFYAVVIYKQTQVMVKTINTTNNSLILTISLLQIIFGLILLALSLLFI